MAMNGAGWAAARTMSPSARAMPIDTAMSATRVESARPSVANSSTGRCLVEGLVDMMDLRESRTTICRKALSRYRQAFVRTWAKPLMNKGDFVNLVNKVLTSGRQRRERGRAPFEQGVPGTRAKLLVKAHEERRALATRGGPR